MVFTLTKVTLDGSSDITVNNPMPTRPVKNADDVINPCFVTLGSAVSQHGMSYKMMIDLSDTTNWPHDNTGHIRLITESLTMDVPAEGSGTATLGVIKAIDGTEATIALFFGRAFGQEYNEDINIFRSFAEYPLSFEISAGEFTKFMPSSLITTADINTGMTLDGPNGQTGITPAVGDIIARYDRQGRAKFTPAFQLTYWAAP